jgi:hypothetical protein
VLLPESLTAIGGPLPLQYATRPPSPPAPPSPPLPLIGLLLQLLAIRRKLHKATANKGLLSTRPEEYIRFFI